MASVHEPPAECPLVGCHPGFRWAEDRSTMKDGSKDSQTDLWLTYLGLADWLSVGAGYKRVYTKAGDGGWRTR